MSTANAMRIVNPHVGFVLNHEVRDVLLSLRSEQDALLDNARSDHARALDRDSSLPAFDERAERSRVLSDPQRVVLAKTLQHLEDTSLRRGATASLDQVLAFLRDVDNFVGPETFTKAEKLRLADNPPSGTAEIYALIELAGTRICEVRGLPEAEENHELVMQEILNIANRYFEERTQAGANGHAPDLVDAIKPDDEDATMEQGLRPEDKEEIEEAMAEDHEETDLVQEQGQARDAHLEIDEVVDAT